jgi:hypothetical protein
MQAACEKLPASPAESLPQLAGLVHAMNVYAGPSEPWPGLCQASFNDLFTSQPATLFLGERERNTKS